MTQEQIEKGNKLLEQIEVCNMILKHPATSILISHPEGRTGAINLTNEMYPEVLAAMFKPIRKRREILKEKFKAL